MLDPREKLCAKAIQKAYNEFIFHGVRHVCRLNLKFQCCDGSSVQFPGSSAV